MYANGIDLSNSNFLRYLRMLYEMESSVYQQEELIKQLSSIDTTLPPAPPPDKGKPVFKLKKLSPSALKAIGIIVLLVTVVLIILDPSTWLYSIAGVLFFLGLTAVIYLFTLNYRSIVGKAANKQDVAQWEIDNARRSEYAAAVARKNYLEKEIFAAKNKATGSRQLLTQMYANNMIYPKYRNLPAISSFLDYFSSGRCSSLTGPYGAYNLYENEARLDGIITRLDNISTQLNRIQFNQQMLFYAVRDCNETVNRLYHAVKDSADHLCRIAGSQSRIEENVAMAAYRTKLLEKEAAYRNQMTYGVNYQ